MTSFFNCQSNADFSEAKEVIGLLETGLEPTSLPKAHRAQHVGDFQPLRAALHLILLFNLHNPKLRN